MEESELVISALRENSSGQKYLAEIYKAMLNKQPRNV